DLPAGHDVDFAQIHLELYRLITAFLSDDALAKLIGEDIRAGKIGHYDHHALYQLRETFFRSEIFRTFICTAIQCRLLAEWKHEQDNPAWQKTCGTLETAGKDAPLKQGPLGGAIAPLTVREAFNKIIRVERINFDSEDAVLYLYGRQNN